MQNPVIMRNPVIIGQLPPRFFSPTNKVSLGSPRNAPEARSWGRTYISKNIKEYQRISKNIKEYQRISKNIKEYQRISNNTKEYQRIPKNTKEYQRISKNIKEYQPGLGFRV